MDSDWKLLDLDALCNQEGTWNLNESSMEAYANEGWKLDKDTEMENWNLNRQNDLNEVKRIKQELRRGNCSYICRHPELRAIVRVFLHELIDKQPDNICEFSASLFNCNNTPLLVSKINKQLQRVHEQLRRSQWSHYDIEGIFSETASTHSLLSRASMAADIDRMLRYALILRDRE